jgi:hypothetical protein
MTHNTRAPQERLHAQAVALGPIDYRVAAELLGITTGMAWAIQWSLGWAGAASKPHRPWFAPLPPEPEPEPQEPSDG